MNLNNFKMTLSILIRQEEDQYVAHCLEMDLKGRGSSEEESVSELMDLVVMQVSFAFHKKEPGLLYHPAEKEFFDLFSDQAP